MPRKCTNFPDIPVPQLLLDLPNNEASTSYNKTATDWLYISQPENDKPRII